MSMGTIVTIVLVVVTLVLALVLIRGIFKGGTSAVTQVNSAVQNQINKLFASQGGNIHIYPATPVTIKRGDSTPSGFQFAVMNPDNANPSTFEYQTSVSDLHNCGSLTNETAKGYIINGHGTLTASAGAVSDNQVILFEVPTTAPACTITYTLTVTGSSSNVQSFSTSGPMFLSLN